MFETNLNARRRVLPLAVSLCALMCASQAFARNAASQETGEGKKQDAKKSVSRSKPTSPNTTVNLLNLMVKRELLTQEEADGLIKQAENEAYVSREAAKDATAKADEAAKAATAASAAANPPGTRHVTYVPEIVKRQLRDEIKKEVMAKAEKENWASPGAYPEWAQRIHFYGDVRARYQGSFFPTGNDQHDAINFNAINTGSPYDVASGVYYPTYNVTQNRDQFRFRGRLGMEADLTSGFTAGFRIATGDSNSPVSTNQTLGANGGNFSKYSLWLDRGYLNYSTWGKDLSISVGRFDNPFWRPTDLVWYNEIAWDGFAIQAKHEVVEGYTPFAVLGAAPVFNTDFNAGINLDTTGVGAPTKLPSHDKWLFGGQVGFDARFNADYSFRVAAAYYDFSGVQGQESSPCQVNSASDVCNTDYTRPSFAQKGNTYVPLRNIIGTASNNYGAGPNLFQYFGLASQFRPAVASAQLDIAQFNPVHIILDGEYVVNTAFNRAYMQSLAAQGLLWNNFGPSPDPAHNVQVFSGGNQGWLARVTVGDKEIKHLWDWNVHAGYKYLESDAMVDAFVDSDFGLGGTNLKGYFVGGNLGLSENVWGSLRWMSANNVSGVPYAVDVLLVDVNARF